MRAFVSCHLGRQGPSRTVGFLCVSLTCGLRWAAQPDQTTSTSLVTTVALVASGTCVGTSPKASGKLPRSSRWGADARSGSGLGLNRTVGSEAEGRVDNAQARTQGPSRVGEEVRSNHPVVGGEVGMAGDKDWRMWRSTHHSGGRVDLVDFESPNPRGAAARQESPDPRVEDP